MQTRPKFATLLNKRFSLADQKFPRFRTKGVRDGSGPDCRRWALHFDRSVQTLTCVREVTRAICSLPAIPTQDWMDRAAAALTAVAEGSVALVFLASIDQDGRILGCNAVGAADSTGAIGSQTETLKSRVYRIPKLQLGGWRPGAEDPLVAHLAALAPDWRNSPIGRIWPQPYRGELVFTVSGAPGAPSLFTVHDAPGDARIAMDVLPIVLPMLAETAVRTLGTSAADPRQRLTFKEQQVLDQLALGRSVKQIAESLKRSPHTVHDHVKALHRKLTATTRGELVAKALGHLPPSGKHVKHPARPRSGSAPSH